MSGKNINFDTKKSKKSSFIKTKKINKIDDIDVKKILVSKKEPYGTKYSFKYFSGYNDNDVIRHYYRYRQYNYRQYNNKYTDRYIQTV